MTQRAGYVLTGGRSSRFGENKALVDVDGKPMAVHVADRIRPACHRIKLVGAAATYNSLGLPVIEDATADFGPVAGILAALEDTSAEWNLIVACDMPDIGPEIVEWLFRRAEDSDVEAVVPQEAGGRSQPLCAVYRRGLAATMRQAVEAGIHKVTTALDGAEIDYVGASEYAALDSRGDIFLNVNRPEDLARRR